LILKAKIDYQATTYNSKNNTNDQAAISLVHQASYAGAFEKDLDDILHQIEQKMTSFQSLHTSNHQTNFEISNHPHHGTQDQNGGTQEDYLETSQTNPSHINYFEDKDYNIRYNDEWNQENQHLFHDIKQNHSLSITNYLNDENNNSFQTTKYENNNSLSPSQHHVDRSIYHDNHDNHEVTLRDQTIIMNQNDDISTPLHEKENIQQRTTMTTPEYNSLNHYANGGKSEDHFLFNTLPFTKTSSNSENLTDETSSFINHHNDSELKSRADKLKQFNLVQKTFKHSPSSPLSSSSSFFIKGTKSGKSAMDSLREAAQAKH